MKIVQPVVLDPWEREWAEEKKALAAQIEKSKKVVSEAAKKRYFAFLERLYQYRVLDPACGSGNFLYLTLRGLKNFEKKVIHEAEALGLPRQFPRVGPEAVLGIEVNPYAVELARVTVWIGEIQWMLENGFGVSKDPILKPLGQIECRDAILNEDGTQPQWPKADAIVGNPPFLGDRKLTTQLGEDYVRRLRNAYSESIRGSVDLVCYWFDKACRHLIAGEAGRVGLVATNSIRGGFNRQVLERIAEETPIFTAWSDEPWVLDGAAVRVSIVCFDRSEGDSRVLDGQPVERINPDLTSLSVNLANAQPLAENAGVAFNGIQKTGPFEVPGTLARQWLTGPQNPHGRPNADVLRPYWNGIDVTRRSRDSWIVDFTGMTEQEAALFERPFEHLAATVKPERMASTVKNARDRDWLVANWWLFWRVRPELAAARAMFERVIVTPEVAKHRVFAWAPSVVGIDKNLIAFARDDDTTFGILQSTPHRLWSLRLGTSLEDRPRYTPSTAFETFPFPDGLAPNIPAVQFLTDPRAQRVAAAARRLNELREAWLNPPELVVWEPEFVHAYPKRAVPRGAAEAAELKRRTLTELYNFNPAWLVHAQRDLDIAVASAYGWEWPLSDDEVLKRLFDLNQARSTPTPAAE